MSFELNLRFPDPRHLFVTLGRQSAGPLDFAARVTAKDREEIRWYLETYAARYTTDVDDVEARRIEAKLPEWGTALFDATFHDRAARYLFSLFQDMTNQDRLLTIGAEHPAVLSLPWELLRDPKGVYLFNEDPRISIRRRVAEATGRRAYDPKVKPRLRLLFVTSRPSDAVFIDPRSEPQAVMDAVEQHAPGRIEVEFLRPATFRNLAERLGDKSLPTVDVIHFDGHGAFDTEGSFGDETPNMGYLLFERESGLTQFVSPEFWHQSIGDYGISLVVLSACQSAAISDSGEGGEAKEPMGTVAYGLTALGVPAVLAMTHSLLVETAGQLFGEFYGFLAEGNGIGVALDDARDYLMRNPQKHEVQRGTERVRLTVQDWFLPALYQAVEDVPLLYASARVAPDGLADVESEVPHSVSAGGNTGLSSELPELQEAGFFGRQRELWDIERWFVAGARRISITGFGGQGKTYLATEAGRWLRRTGMFERVALVSYAAFQGVDAVGYAVATLGTGLGESLTDANVAMAALKQTPTLVILDNLEDLAPAPLAELLSAAKTWSECGDSRVLLTGSAPDFHHADYPLAGSLKHRSMTLAGLGEEDALSYFQSLMKLPPKPKFPPPERDALLELFRLVSFHPLSIHQLAVQLKTHRVAELGKRLESLLAEGGDDKNQSLRTSLLLSLDRLDAESRQWLPRLGIFQGGAMENILLVITEIPEVQWPDMRERLQAAALIEVESLDGVLYLRFHPSLAPLLWSRLTQPEQDALSARYRQCYYHFSTGLNLGDRKLPHHFRAIARRELPNLLYAVHGALAASNEWAADFTDKVGYFLNVFSLNRDYKALTEPAAVLEPEAGSRAWYLHRYNLGTQLVGSGRIQQAEAVFREVMFGLGASPSYESCATLLQLGACHRSLGRRDLAEQSYRDVLDLLDMLEQSTQVKHLRGASQFELGNVLTDMARYAEAQAAYETALSIAEKLEDFREIGLTNAHFGALALSQGDLPEAARRYGEALRLFQRLNEPMREAVYGHQLGIVFQQAGQSEAAEKAYRDSAQIAEALEDFTGAAHSWNQLAMLSEDAGKLQAAEAWYRKALEGYKIGGAEADLSATLSSLASLLQNRPGRLADARQLAEESLAVKTILDPSAAQIWRIYSVLARIADKENDPAQARDYRRRGRAAYTDFPDNLSELQGYTKLIAAVRASISGNLAAQQAVSREQEVMHQAGGQWVGLPQAIDHLLAGKRDADVLTANLDALPSLIIEAILEGIKEPRQPRSPARQ